MRYLTLILGLSLLLITGCRPTQKQEGNGSLNAGVDKGDGASSGQDKGGGGPNNNAEQPEGKTYKVTGQVMYTKAYCGGAAPSEEMLEQYRTPMPLADLKLHVRKGSSNTLGQSPVQTVQTDGEGRFTFTLPPGEYCLITDDRLKKPDPNSFKPGAQQIDIACSDAWIVKCDHTFVIKDADLKDIALNFHRRCFLQTFNPCVHYDGPLPP